MFMQPTPGVYIRFRLTFHNVKPYISKSNYDHWFELIDLCYNKANKAHCAK